MILARQRQHCACWQGGDGWLGSNTLWMGHWNVINCAMLTQRKAKFMEKLRRLLCRKLSFCSGFLFWHFQNEMLIASSFFVAVQRYDWFSRKSRSHTSWPSGSAVSSKHQRFVSPGFDGSNRGTVEVPQSRPATVSARARVEQRFHGFFREDLLRVEGDQQSG